MPDGGEGGRPREAPLLAPCALLSFADDGTVRLANAQLHRWLGAADGALLGAHVDRLLAPASRVFHGTHFFPLLKLHGKADEVALLLRAASGEDVPVMASAVRDTQGPEPLNHCAMMTMWRRKEFELALVEARRAAEAATAAKDEFLAVLSHELRTPLNAITGWVKLMRSGKLDALQQQRAIEVIERNAQAQAQLIEDLLDTSRIVRGQLRVSARPTHLAPVVEAVLDNLRPSAQARQIALERAIDAQAGTVRADPARMQQIVSNLVSNALKFTPKGGRVRVALSRAGSCVRLEVADTGQGIEPAKLPFVFDRFWQGSDDARTASAGLGLGLSICKSLVELHGGSIRADSAGPGQGAAFTVELPLAAAVVDDAEAGAALLPGPHGAPSLDGVRVVVVDDDADARNVLLMVLRAAGAQVRAAASADEAMQAVRHEPPDVVVSDIGMPRKDGYAFVRELRADPALARAPLAAIAVTGLAAPQDRLDMLRAGFQSHVEKPVEPAELVALVAALARRG
jgi:signal transduction histidine kinase